MKKKLFAIILCLAMMISLAASLSEVSFAEEKTFTLMKGEEKVGVYDTFADVMEKRASDTGSYTIIVNKDYDIPATEGCYSISDCNILIKSAIGKTCTLKRLGTRCVFLVSSNCKIRTENIIFDGNSDGEFTSLTNNGELTFGKGTVVQNFIDVPSADGPAINVDDKSTLNIEAGVTIQNNKGNSMGGVIEGRYEDTKINIYGGTFIGNSCEQYGGVIKSCGEVNITGGIFTGNKANSLGGVIYSSGILNINGGTFKENYANFGSVVFTNDTNNANIKKAVIESNVSKYGALYFNGGSSSVENTTFNNNLAFNRGSAIYNRGADVTVSKSTFKDNGEMTDGTGTYKCDLGGAKKKKKVSDTTKLTVKESTFDGNKAEKDGGAIHTSDSNYVNTVDTSTDYQILNVDKETVFKNNKASGYFNPPENIAELTNINAKETSFTGTNKIKPDSPLNNYDINYKRNIVITYDPNDGSKAVEDKQTANEIKDYPIKSPAELKFTNTAKFLGWSEDKNSKNPEYKAGNKVDLTGNLYLYAIWEKPAPKPAEPSTVILTLDENYRNGKITNIEVEVGDLIEPHLYIPRRRGYIFRGWSYDRKHLDEVKPEDRIYSDTILYAIWKKAEIEKHEEPEEIRGEEHKAYIFGYPNGTVRPNGNITRAEAAAMLSRLLNIEAIGSAAKPNFKDTESSWYNKAINAIVARGIMKGYPDGRFRPNAPITRAEFTQMISTIDNKPYGEAPFVDVKGHWAERAIGSEYQAKRITGYPDGLFRPDSDITRAEAAVILNKIFERNYDAMSLAKCKNALMLKRFIDLDETFWGYNDMVEATNTHEYVRRYKEDMMKRLEEDWLLIKDINDVK